MAMFVCRYGTPGGAIETARRDAADPEVLRRELEQAGLFVFGIWPARRLAIPGLASLAALLGPRVPDKALLLFTQEFHALARAGLPVIQVFDTLVRQTTNARLKDILLSMRDDVSGGMAVSDAAAQHPGVFSHVFVASLRSGERSGTFVESLARHAALLKRVLAVRKRVFTALTYPAILIGLSTAVVVFLLTYVMPIFSRMYANFDAALPTPTLVLVQVTNVLGTLAVPIAGGVLLTVLSVRRWLELSSGRRRLHGCLLRVPMLGDVIRRYSASTFCRTLATLLGGGLPIVTSLETAAQSVSNTALRERLAGAIPTVVAGGSLGGALERSGILPPAAVEMIAVGESAGSLPEMLAQVADFFDEEVDTRLQSLTAVIEPLIMIVMGIFVGTIVVVMYLPIFELSEQVR